LPEFLGDHLSNTDIEHWTDDRFHRFGVVDVDDVIEGAGRACVNLLDCAQIGRNAQILDTQLTHQGQSDLVEPGFQKQPFARVLEQTAPVVIVPIDEAGNDHHSGKIDDFASVLRTLVQIRHRADCADAIIVDPDPAVANNFSRGIDSNEVAVSKEQGSHAKSAILTSILLSVHVA
jgi:hypothetical protein